MTTLRKRGMCSKPAVAMQKAGKATAEAAGLVLARLQQC